MALVVGDVQPRAADREALRVRELARRHDDRRLRALDREALDAVVAGVGDVEQPVRRGQAAAGARVVAAAPAEEELAHVRPRRAPAVQERAAGMEAVDAVAPVGDEERPVVRHGERADRAQLARPLAGGADLAQELPLRREDLHDVRALVADVDVAVRADRDRLREAQDAARALADLGCGDPGTRGICTWARHLRGLRRDGREKAWRRAQGGRRRGVSLGGHQGVEHGVAPPDADTTAPDDRLRSGRRADRRNVERPPV